MAPSNKIFQDTIPREFEPVHTYLTSIIQQQQLAGIIALVYQKGAIKYIDKLGWQSKTNQIPMDYDTIFRIASMTKPIVSIAALMLFEAGHFQLDDPIANYLPQARDMQVLTPVALQQGTLEVEELQHDITFRHIMTHSAGFSYGWDPASPLDQLYQRTMAKRGNKNLAEGIDDLLALPLAFQPGTNWQYSVATDILGRLIEVIAKQPLDRFLLDRIFTPLNMVDTGFYVPTVSRSRIGPVYTHKNQELQILRPLEHDPVLQPPSFLSGGGGLVSTLRDYFNFCKMLLHLGKFQETQLLQPETIQLMQTDHLTDSVPELKVLGSPIRGYRFGLGVAVKTGTNNQKLAKGSYNWSGAATTDFIVDPVNNLFAIFLAQYMPVFNQLPAIQRFYKLAYTALGL